MTYQMNEGYLPLEGVWQDQTVNVLVPRESATKGINLVCSRDLLPMGVSIEAYLEQQRKNFAKELPKFSLLADALEVLDGQPAHLFEFTWTNQGGLLHQIMIVTCQEDRIFSLTATVPGGMDDAMREKQLAILRSFKFGPAPDVKDPVA